MKRTEIVERAIDIGNDSWALNSFLELKESASLEDQIQALKDDRKWINNHVEGVLGCLDSLIREMDNELWAREKGE